MKRHVPEMSLFESATEYSQHPRKVECEKERDLLCFYERPLKDAVREIRDASS